ncbi:hypothetical protein MM440_04365 [Arsenicicoccus piscis]|uniref:Glycosyl transferase family 4 n=1 Tax=Arsenicicoccus piscis TaxID=673954 RepID=A0ABQ6HKN1_9MICO|nr:hypothetical protein [Arsenicicoccus piscis]MCH8627038.1 hypothetical protein [Arsenicicoccus piscis]GMA19029.1 hypothetical protein GCM10025862_10500 [Arsenicicoccus piscis]
MTWSVGAAGGTGAVAVYALLTRWPPGGVERWTRTSHAGRSVTLLEGPAYALGALGGLAWAATTSGRPRGSGSVGAGTVVAGAAAVTGAAVVGALDDLAGATDVKGLRGHLGALREGRVTTGSTKIAVLGLTGLVTTLLVDRAGARLLGTLVGTALVAGSANLVNLFDLRPGRALKVTLGAAGLLAAGGDAGPVQPEATRALALAAAGPAVALLPEDLAGRAMLGDTGANAAGALLGTALLTRLGPRGRLGALAVVSALVLASERVSFTRVIEATPVLRELDRLGRS